MARAPRITPPKVKSSPRLSSSQLTQQAVSQAGLAKRGRLPNSGQAVLGSASGSAMKKAGRKFVGRGAIEDKGGKIAKQQDGTWRRFRAPSPKRGGVFGNFESFSGRPRTKRDYTMKGLKFYNGHSRRI